jgi:hypothetical protein
MNKNGEIKLLINVCVPRTDKCNENAVKIAERNAIPPHVNIVFDILNTATVVKDVTIDCMMRPTYNETSKIKF